MALTYHEVEEARRDAELTIQRADMASRQAAKLIAGRLRSAGVAGHILEELKRELKDYNMHTGRWKNAN